MKVDENQMKLMLQHNLIHEMFEMIQETDDVNFII